MDILEEYPFPLKQKRPDKICQGVFIYRFSNKKLSLYVF